MTGVPTVSLNSGVQMPQLGFGVFQIPAEETYQAVSTAIQAGYRSIDTATAYRNEESVGLALADAEVPREELFVTTKLWNAHQGYDSTIEAFEASMKKLRLDVLDLYLIHWPTPKFDTYVDSWKAMVELYRAGRIRAIGVSNFQPNHLHRVIDESGVTPAVNQVELHPRFQQAELRELHSRLGIATEAYSPLAQGGELLDDPVITGIADKHGKTPAQIVLRWHVENGIIVIPKSVTPERIRANIDIFDFALEDDDLAAIGGMDKGERIGGDPDTMNVR